MAESAPLNPLSGSPNLSCVQCVQSSRRTHSQSGNTIYMGCQDPGFPRQNAAQSITRSPHVTPLTSPPWSLAPMGHDHGLVPTLSCPWPGSDSLIAIDGGLCGGHRGESGMGSGTTAQYPAGCGARCVLTPALLNERSCRTAALPPDSFPPHTHGHVSSDC